MKHWKMVGSLLGIFLMAGTVAAQQSALPDTMLGISGDDLTLKTFPRPSPGANEVLIKVRDASINPVDWRVSEGSAGGPPGGGAGGPPGGGAGGPPGGGAPGGMAGGPPGGGPGGAAGGPPGGGRGGPMAMNSNNIPGFDAAGVIAAVGEGVTDWKVGDEVVAFLDARGAYAQYAVAPVSAIAKKSSKLTFEQAAGIPTVSYAAWAVLVDVADVGKGDRVLIHGGSGGVGSTAIQIAKARGAAYIYSTASKRNHEYLKSLGVDEPIDYNAVNFEDVAKDLDIVMNTVGADTANRSVPIVKKGGMLVTVSGRADADKCSAAGITCSGRTMGGNATPVGEVMKQINAMADAGQYTVNVDEVYPLEKLSEAFEKGREGHNRGKIIISIPQ